MNTPNNSSRLKRPARYATVLLAGIGLACCAESRTADDIRVVNVLEILDAARNMQPIYQIKIDSYEDFIRAGYQPPKDPITAKPYEYRRKDDLVTVCTNFDAPSADFKGAPKVVYGDPVVHGYGVWTHGGGHQCLTRDVAPSSAWNKGE